MDDQSIAPRRALPPVPPAGRAGTTRTLTPPTDRPLENTSWFDPLEDSAVHPAVGALAALAQFDDPHEAGTAEEAAHALLVESGRQLVLDPALLAALDAAARAAEARRALTAQALPAAPAAVLTTVETPVARARPVPAPAAVAGPVTADGPVPPDATATTGAPAAAPDPAEVDVDAEFARHDDLVETGRHEFDDDAVHDTGRHAAFQFGDSDAYPPVQAHADAQLAAAVDLDHPEDDGYAGTGLTHRTVITRPGRRWIPAGIGAGVLAIVSAVLLTSGFANGTTGTDEAARTGTSSTAPTTPAPGTPAATPTSPIGTIDLSGIPSTAGTGTQPTAGSARPSSSAAPTSARTQPQVATAPTPGTATSSSTAPAGAPTPATGSTTDPANPSTVETTPPPTPTTAPTTAPTATPDTPASQTSG